MEFFISLLDEPGDDQPFVASNNQKVNTNLYLYSVSDEG